MGPHAKSILLGACLVACGSRSELDDVSEINVPNAGGAVATGGAPSVGGTAGTTGGGGVVASGGTAGAGATAGMAGATAECPSFDVQSPVELWPDLPGPDSSPRLVFARQGATDAALVFHTPANLNTRLVAVGSFSPWEDWPPPPGTSSKMLESQAYGSVVASAGFGAHLAILERHQFYANPSATSADPGPSIQLKGNDDIFVARGTAGRFLVATSSANKLFVHSVLGSAQPTPITFGCGKNAASGDAVAYAGGWLLALSNGSAAPQLGCEGGPTSDSTRIDLFWISPNVEAKYLTSIETGSIVGGLQLAPHSRGAFLVYSGLDDAEVLLVTSWALVDVAEQTITNGGVLSAMPYLLAGGVNADAAQDRLAVTWLEPDGESQRLELVVLDDSGKLLASADIPVEPSYAPVVLARPDAGSFLVAAATSSANRAWRFDCVISRD